MSSGSEIPCPAPDCTVTWPSSTNPDVLIRLIDLHSRTAHPVSTPSLPVQTVTTSKAEKVKRPHISAAGTSEEWAYFLDRWSDYKNATRLSDTDVVYQLLECCDDNLRRDLSRSVKSITSRDEASILHHIKLLAVRQENVMVSRLELQQMRQDRDEPVRTFAARLKGQSRVCQYLVDCHCGNHISYSDEMVRDTMIIGLADHDIQLDILGQADQNMSLEDTIRYVEAKESGKRSSGRIGPSMAHPGPPQLSQPSVDAVSTFKRQERKRLQNQTRLPDGKQHATVCGHCGKAGHGRRRQDRMAHCPAYSHVCSKCGSPHHFESVCRKSRQQLSSTPDDATAVFQSLCSIETATITLDETPSSVVNSITLEHHIYNSMCDMWHKQASAPQPTIDVTIQAIPSDATALGIQPMFSTATNAIKSIAVADTGCQSCLAGTSILGPLGMTKEHLIPTTMRMKAANRKSISILGALVLRITGLTQSGKSITTRQIVYITDSTDKLFLSREACVALGLLPASFPSFDSTSALNDGPNLDQNDDNECHCPSRQAPPPIPTTLPFPATEENREHLEKWLLNHYKASTFNVCPHQTLPMMSGPPMGLMISPDAKPVAHHTPIPVPVHWQEQVKAGLDQDVSLGVIEPVPVGTPVTWCHHMVVCAKKSGKPRRTVDLQALNRYATRETHHTQSPFHQARAVPPNMRKTTFDAWNGYHSILLDEKDRHFTTFITPWGRYRYRVCPQGYVASGDAYTRRFDEIVNDFKNKKKVIDDTIMWSDTIEDCFFQAAEWLDLCGRNGIILNPSKFQFAGETVTFAGFEISSNRVTPCPQTLEAIEKFPTPKNITDIRSWFGLVNQVSYAFACAERMQPFRSLLKPNTRFMWTSRLDNIFTETKQLIIDEIKKGVEIFDANLPTCLATDFSKDGLGYWLFQKHCLCESRRPFCCRTGWRIALVGSRFTSSAESRYAPIEGEALAVVDALQKTRHFVLGCPNLMIAVDHKPLLKVFGDRGLDAIPNPRLRNLKEKTLQFRFRMVHIPGMRHVAADAISRHPVGSPAHLSLPDDATPMLNEAQPMPTMPHNVLMAIRTHDNTSTVCSGEDACIGLNSLTWDDVRLATNTDTCMNNLLNLVENGFPQVKNDLPDELKVYYQYRDNLNTFDGVVLYNDRIVIPPSLRDKVVQSLHSAHQGVSQMCSRANASFFWPGMTSDINEIRLHCSSCNRMAPSQPNAPPTPPIQPQYPFQCICADFFHYAGHNYLVIVDRYSNWPIVEKASNGSQGLISSLRRTFATYGISDELSSDGGPEFTSLATRTFLRDWGVNHRLSSVAFPHSNSRAEIGVKTVKRMIVDNTGPDGSINTTSFQRAILQYRNTPDRDTRLSPAMCIFGRPIRDFLPIHPGKYLPHPTWQETLSSREEALRNRHMRDAERLSAHTRVLPPLVVGDCVRIQNQIGPFPTKWDKTGIVIEVRQFDQYVIRVDGSGRVTLRNRKFLRKYMPVITRSPLAMIPTPHAHTSVKARCPTNNMPPIAKDMPHQSPTPVPPPTPAHISIEEIPTNGNTPLQQAVVPMENEPPTAISSEPTSKNVAEPPTPVTTPILREPRALRALRPFNKPGSKEDTPFVMKRTTRSRSETTWHK